MFRSQFGIEVHVFHDKKTKIEKSLMLKAMRHTRLLPMTVQINTCSTTVGIILHSSGEHKHESCWMIKSAAGGSVYNVLLPPRGQNEAVNAPYKNMWVINLS